MNIIKAIEQKVFTKEKVTADEIKKLVFEGNVVYQIHGKNSQMITIIRIGHEYFCINWSKVEKYTFSNQPVKIDKEALYSSVAVSTADQKCST